MHHERAELQGEISLGSRASSWRRAALETDHLTQLFVNKKQTFVASSH